MKGAAAAGELGPRKDHGCPGTMRKRLEPGGKRNVCDVRCMGRSARFVRCFHSGSGFRNCSNRILVVGSRKLLDCPSRNLSLTGRAVQRTLG